MRTALSPLLLLLLVVTAPKAVSPKTLEQGVYGVHDEAGDQDEPDPEMLEHLRLLEDMDVLENMEILEAAPLLGGADSQEGRGGESKASRRDTTAP